MKCLLYKTILIMAALLFFAGGGKTALAAFTDVLSYTSDFTVGTLDFKLKSGGENIPNNIFEFKEMNGGSREIVVEDIGSLEFVYSVDLRNISGNMEFCNALNVSMTKGNDTAFTGNLQAFSSNTSYKDSSSPWTLNYESGATFSESKLCVFDIVFRGWQENAEDFESSGFTSVETLTVIITSSPVLPSPSSDDVSDLSTVEEVAETGAVSESNDSFDVSEESGESSLGDTLSGESGSLDGEIKENESSGDGNSPEAVIEVVPSEDASLAEPQPIEEDPVPAERGSQGDSSSEDTSLDNGTSEDESPGSTDGLTEETHTDQSGISEASVDTSSESN